MASDQGLPEMTDLSEVIVTVTRDQFAPQFQGTPYFASAMDKDPVNITVFNVLATDQDSNVSSLIIFIGIPLSYCKFNDYPLCDYIIATFVIIIKAFYCKRNLSLTSLGYSIY